MGQERVRLSLQPKVPGVMEAAEKIIRAMRIPEELLGFNDGNLALMTEARLRFPASTIFYDITSTRFWDSDLYVSKHHHFQNIVVFRDNLNQEVVSRIREADIVPGVWTVEVIAKVSSKCASTWTHWRRQRLSPHESAASSRCLSHCAHLLAHFAVLLQLPLLTIQTNSTVFWPWASSVSTPMYLPSCWQNLPSGSNEKRRSQNLRLTFFSLGLQSTFRLGPLQFFTPVAAQVKS